MQKTPATASFSKVQCMYRRPQTDNVLGVRFAEPRPRTLNHTLDPKPSSRRLFQETETGNIKTNPCYVRFLGLTSSKRLKTKLCKP